MSDKPRCETCPFWEKLDTDGWCHWGRDSGIFTDPDWWCRHHPDAPKVVTVKQEYRRSEEWREVRDA